MIITRVPGATLPDVAAGVCPAGDATPPAVEAGVRPEPQPANTTDKASRATVMILGSTANGSAILAWWRWPRVAAPDSAASANHTPFLIISTSSACVLGALRCGIRLEVGA